MSDCVFDMNLHDVKETSDSIVRLSVKGCDYVLKDVIEYVLLIMSLGMGRYCIKFWNKSFLVLRF